MGGKTPRPFLPHHFWSFGIRCFSSCCCWKPGEEVRGELLLWGHQWNECARSLLGSLSLSAPTTQRGLGVLMIPRVWLPSWGDIRRLPARAGCSLRGGQTFWGGPEGWPFPTRRLWVMWQLQLRGGMHSRGGLIRGCPPIIGVCSCPRDLGDTGNPTDVGETPQAEPTMSR